ncbi:MAG: LuxR C-terminal-related transcriptional regulator [Acidimicrobiales bacterium]
MSGLTEREIEVLRLVAEGCDTAEIAGRPAYSERTIKNIVHDVIVRLALRNRTHAVAYAVREGLI